MVGRAHVRDIRASVADMVDQFINAYLAMNPGQAGRAPPLSRASPPPKRRWPTELAKWTYSNDKERSFYV
jgi:hypothetical protein